MKDKSPEISERVLQLLQNYSWPGNVRELENCILRAMLLAGANRIEAEDLPEEVKGEGEYPQVAVPKDSEELRRVKWQWRRRAEDEVEKAFLREALKRSKGNISKAALDVGMDRRQLQNLIRKHKMVVKEFKVSSSPVDKGRH
jgi:DNA-binding NtrC family response regulator